MQAIKVFFPQFQESIHYIPIGKRYLCLLVFQWWQDCFIARILLGK